MTSRFLPGLSIVFNQIPEQKKRSWYVRMIFFLVTSMGWGHSACTYAQVSISPLVNNEFLYTQNFNSLANTGSSNTWTNNVTLQGWYAAMRTPGPAPQYFATYRATVGTSGSADLHSLGKHAAHSTTLDRALGAVNNDGDTEDIVFGVLFENNSGAEIRSVTVSFRAEQWRRVMEVDKYGYQRTKVSWFAADAVPVGESDLFDETTFQDIAEATIISIDTTTQLPSDSINGNVVFRNVEVQFPVSIPPGWQFFLRFYDENASGIDVAMGIDDVNILFSSGDGPHIMATSGYPVSAYLDMGIVQDIPAKGALGYDYIEPNQTDADAWEDILGYFYSQNWGLVDASDYGYELAQFTEQQTGRTFFILRRQSTSGYYWGTYVLAINPANGKLIMQAPHPVDDARTGREASAIFDFTGARALMMANISRCASATGGCTGSSSACQNYGGSYYRVSDFPHTPVSIFHTATTVLATQFSESVFVQMHGFSQAAAQPADLYISCGTLNALDKNVPDYAVMVREGIVSPPSGWDDLGIWSGDPEWDVQLTHVDDNSTLGARDNIQGRFLNEHTEVCNNPDPEFVTNRFLHIEQLESLRQQPQYFGKIAAAIGNAINDDEYVRGIPISLSNSYMQDFNNLSDNAGSHTWGNNLHLPGWYAVSKDPGLFSRYTSDNGTASTSGLYAQGSAGDRALGTLNLNGSSTDHAAYGVLFTNNTDETIYSIQLSYRAEQWRGVNAPSQRVKLGFTIAAEIDLSPNGLLNNNLFTNVTTGDMITVNDAVSGPMNGNDLANSTQLNNIQLPVVLQDGEEIFIRFLDEDVLSTADKVMALDDITVTFSTQSAVPVTWLYFDVTESGGFPELRWGADNEGDCDRYQIERSINGRDFQTIATLGCQRAPFDNQYEFVDLEPPVAARVYYRILQTDFDGETTYSQVVALMRTNHQPEVYYLNGTVHVLGTPDSKLQHLTAVDFLGRSLCEGVPISEGGDRYSISCPVAASIMVVKLNFDTHQHTTLLRTRN
jgi:hypothetical protein